MDNNIISERLKKLLMDKQVRQKDLAEYLGITSNTVSYFITGKRRPNLEQIVKIANFFSVSTDYLIGLSDVSTTDKDIKNACELTGLSENTVVFLSENNQKGSNKASANFIDIITSKIKNDLTLYEKLLTIRHTAGLYYGYLCDGLEYFSSAPHSSLDIDKNHDSIYRLESMIKSTKYDFYKFLNDIVDEFCKPIYISKTELKNTEEQYINKYLKFINAHFNEEDTNGKHTRTEE